MLINDVYVNENAVIAIRFYDGKWDPYNRGIPIKEDPSVSIYANCPEPIRIKCTREEFDRAVKELAEYHSRKRK